MPARTYVRRLSKRANILLTSAVVLKAITLCIYLAGVGRRNGWATSETVSQNGLITYTGEFGLYVAHFEGVYKAAGVAATYTSTVPIGFWAKASGDSGSGGGGGGSNKVLHTVRACQAFSIIGGVLKLVGTTSFIYGRFGARTATQALSLLNKGRLFNLLFLLSNSVLVSCWASLPRDAFYWFCNVYPQQEGQASCVHTEFAPPVGNSSFQGRSYSFDLVMAAGVCAIVGAIASAVSRRTLRRLAEAESFGADGGRRLGGGGGGGGGAILDLGEPLVGGAGASGGLPTATAVRVDPSAPPSNNHV